MNNEIITWKDVDDTLKSMPAKNITDELRLQKLRKISEEHLFLQAKKRIRWCHSSLARRPRDTRILA